MARQPNKTLIGAFVVGAVALAVAGLFIFSSGKFLTETRTFVLYFDGSLTGLDVGAPVNFKGIKIGSVTDIKVEFASEDFTDIQTPVLIEIEPDMLKESSTLVKQQGYQKLRERRKALQRAGTVIKSINNAGLSVYGSLNLQGAAGSEVILTSSRDDSVGGDTNGDGSASQPGSAPAAQIRRLLSKLRRWSCSNGWLKRRIWGERACGCPGRSAVSHGRREAFLRSSEKAAA